MITACNESKIILHLCADIGSDSKPYKDAGYDVRLIGSKIGVENYNPPKDVYGIIANPVCTMFSIARTNAKTPRDIKQGMFLVKHCLRIIWEAQYYMIDKHIPHKLAFWCIENPGTGYLKNYLGIPTYSYHPFQYGENYTKETSLWGNFNIPIPNSPHTAKPKGLSASDIITPMTHRDKKARMHARSMCCTNFAQAFFEVNR